MKLGAALPERLRRLTSRPAAPGGRGAGPALAALGPQLLTVLAAAAIAAQLAILIWKFVPGAHRPPAPPAQRPAPSADVNALLRARLFGAPPSAGASGAEAPRTRVALVLTGTLAVRDPSQGLAIIGETAQNARLHVVGGQLPGGVRLHEVYRDRVVIDRDGVLETLPLPRQATGGASANALPPVSSAGNATEPPLAESVQRLIAQGPEVIGEVLRPMPTYANGQLKGFRVYAGRDRRKFARLGLQAGDLVTQINGVPLGDAQHGMEILRSLGNAGAASVTIERAGGTQQLTIDASQIASLTAPPGEPTPPVPADSAPPNPD